MELTPWKPGQAFLESTSLADVCAVLGFAHQDPESYAAIVKRCGAYSIENLIPAPHDVYHL